MKPSRRAFLKMAGVLPLAGAAHAFDYRRIVALDKVAAHTLLVLGIVPIAAGAIGTYAPLGITLPGSVIEIGVPIEPNLELLQSIRPDLFLTHFDAPRVRRRLERIAPTVVMDIYRGDGRTFDHARSEMLRVALLLGKADAARDTLGRVDAKLFECRAALAGRVTRPVYLVQLGSDGRHVTVFGANSIMQNVFERLGVRNAWTGPTGLYGQRSVGVEALAGNRDARLIHIDYGGDSQAPLRRLAGSPFWSHLPFVKENRIGSMPAFDVYGGFPTAERFARLLTESLLSGTGDHG